MSPIIRAWLTTVDLQTPDYSEVLRSKWGTYFYINGGASVVTMAVVAAAMVVRPGEWVKHPSLMTEEDVRMQKLGEVRGNPGAGKE